MKTRKAIVGIIAIFLFMLGGCHTPYLNGENLPGEMGEQSPYPSSSTTTPSTIPLTSTLEIEKTATATQRPTWTLSPTPILWVDWTPLPDLTSDKARENLRNLLETNGGCDLPCWWGITPGITTIDQTVNILNTISTSMSVKEEVGEVTYLEITFPVPDGYPMFNGQSYVFENNISKIIEASASGVTSFQMKNVLNQYGLPSQVMFMGINSRSFGGKYLFSIDLIYMEKAMLLHYTFEVSATEEYFHICPRYEDAGSVIIWDKNMNLTIYDLNKHLLTHEFDWTWSKPPEKAINLSIEEFVETMIDDSQSGCFDTPRSIWLNPYG